MNINYLVSEYSLSTPALNLYKMNVREEGTREKRKLSTIKMFPIQTCETSQKIN